MTLAASIEVGADTRTETEVTEVAGGKVVKTVTYSGQSETVTNEDGSVSIKMPTVKASVRFEAANPEQIPSEMLTLGCIVSLSEDSLSGKSEKSRAEMVDYLKGLPDIDILFGQRCLLIHEMIDNNEIDIAEEKLTDPGVKRLTDFAFDKSDPIVMLILSLHHAELGDSVKSDKWMALAEQNRLNAGGLMESLFYKSIKEKVILKSGSNVNEAN